MAPVAVAFVLIVGLAVGGVYGAWAVAHHALGDGLAAGLLGVVLAMAAVLLAIVVGVSLAQPLSGWALDAIVRAQMQALGVALPPERPLLRTTAQSLQSSLLALAAGVPLLVLLTAVGWLVPPAAVVTLPVKTLIAGLLLAWDLLDYPLALRGMAVRARIRWCWRNFRAVAGFGLAAALMFAVPGIGLLALPCGVAGATRLVAELPTFP
jgi:CysZ protein